MNGDVRYSALHRSSFIIHRFGIFMAEGIRRKGLGFWSSFLPGFAWMTGFYFVPLGALLVYSFYKHTWKADTPDFTTANFRWIFSSATNVQIFWRTVRIASTVTIIDGLIAFPVAYFLAFYAGRIKQTLIMLILLPLWSSYLVRIFSWKLILERHGLLNWVLLKLHIISAPSPDFIYNMGAVTAVLCYVWLPFMILPLTAALERLPRRLLEASADLGAGPFRTFYKITTPLVMPGLLAGCVSVFSLSMGDYVTADLVGSGSSVLGKLIFDRYGVATNWPQAAALSLCIMVVLFLIFGVLARFGAFD